MNSGDTTGTAGAPTSTASMLMINRWMTSKKRSDASILEMSGNALTTTNDEGCRSRTSSNLCCRLPRGMIYQPRLPERLEAFPRAHLPVGCGLSRGRTTRAQRSGQCETQCQLPWKRPPLTTSEEYGYQLVLDGWGGAIALMSTTSSLILYIQQHQQQDNINKIYIRVLN